MKESRGLGLTEVRFNFNNYNLAYAQVLDNTSLKPLNISSPQLKMPNLKICLHDSNLSQQYNPNLAFP
jgi:hypothetical protein